MAPFGPYTFYFGGIFMLNPPKKPMIVACEYDFCVYNRGHKCMHDEIGISIDGLCTLAVDRIKLSDAVETLEEEKRTIKKYR